MPTLVNIGNTDDMGTEKLAYIFDFPGNTRRIFDLDFLFGLGKIRI